MSDRASRPIRSRWIALVASLSAIGACASTPNNAFVGFVDGRSQPPAGRGLRVLWTEALLAPFEGDYVAVQRAAPAIDPARNRFYVGSTSGQLRALRLNGQLLFRYDVRQAIEAAPAVDEATGTLYLGTAGGEVHAVSAAGRRLWKQRVGATLRTSPALSGDAIYVVTEDDQAVALAKADGAELWRYRREAVEGFTVAGHAGVVYDRGSVFTAFGDGTIVAIDAARGELLWERDTSTDLPDPVGGVPVLSDVDTTPVIVGERVLAASFGGGVYELERSSGTVVSHDAARTGVLGITVAADPWVVLASADHGVLLWHRESHEVRWRVPAERGAPSQPIVVGGLVLVGESEGSILALTLAGGVEVARIESGAGFVAPVGAYADFGAALSNRGTIYAFRIR